MNRLLLFLILSLAMVACKSRKKSEKNGQFFSVLSYLQAQAKNVDTSLYRIIKIETADSTSDTGYIRREDFKTLAKDFLTIPDISSEKNKDDYQESNNYDELLNKILLTYTAKDPNAEIQRETVMLDQDANGNSQIKTIIIDEQMVNKGRAIVKNMLWEVNKRFQVITKTLFTGQPEKIKTLQVVWNDFPDTNASH